MNVLIVSNKFNYGHLSGLMAWYQMFQTLGYDVCFFLDRQYKGCLDEADYKCLADMTGFKAFDYLIIFNISTKDMDIIKQAKHNNPRVKIIFVYHEPWRGLINEIKRFSKDPNNFIRQVGRALFAIPVIKNSSLVVCPSPTALDFYNKSNINHSNKAIEFPLVFYDACLNSDYKIKKEYFSFISTATKDKGFDIFVDFIKYAHKIDKDIKFQIITSSDVTSILDNEIKYMINEGTLLVNHKKGIPEDVMNKAYDDSICTWLVYRSSTQSGVLPKAFMWGSPCIATRVGVFNEIVDGTNGILIDNIKDFDSILNAFYEIRDNQNSFQRNARKTFENYYSALFRLNDLKKILNILGDDIT